MENNTMAASESIRKGLVVYQVLVGIGGAALLVFGFLGLIAPVRPEVIREVGSSTVSWFKLGFALFGFGGAAVAVGFYFVVRGTGQWLEGVSRWTWGDSVNTVRLDDIHSSIQRWLSAGQWAGFVPAGLFAWAAAQAYSRFYASGPDVGTRQLVVDRLGDAQQFGFSVTVGLLMLLIPAVLNLFALLSVRTWLAGVNTPIARRKWRGRSLTDVSRWVNGWFIAAQVFVGLQLLSYALYLLPRVPALLAILFFFPPLGVVGLLIIAVFVGFLLLPILLLEWSKIFMRGVTNTLEPQSAPARARA